MLHLFSCWVMSLFVTPWTAAHQNSMSFTISQTYIHSIDDAIQPSHPLSPLSPPAPNLSQQQSLFQRAGSLHQVAKVLEPQLQHQSFQRIWGLISFRIDRFDLLKGLSRASGLQFKNINSLALCLLYGPNLTSVHDYWKNHCFDYMDFAGKVMPLLSNMQSRFVIVFYQGANVF